MAPESSVADARAKLRDPTRRHDPPEASARIRELERRLGRRERDLAATAEVLEALSHSIAHELRAPLRAVDNFSEILLKEHAATLDAEGVRLLRVVRRNAGRMGSLVTGLLAFAQAARREPTLTRFSFDALVSEVLASEGLQAGSAPFARTSVTLRIAPMSEWYADRGAVREVLLELLANAVKFTSGRGDAARIEISSRVVDSETVCAVSDNGAGFEQQYAHKLFHLFQRLHGAEEFEGLGVGLAIVRRLIESQGGRVWASGAPGSGATVSFALPRREAAEARGEAAQEVDDSDGGAP
jgi:light-regulated signal transduction histidine kinase (bacteriophytochrome)